jgi:hypothetical protein
MQEAADLPEEALLGVTPMPHPARHASDRDHDAHILIGQQAGDLCPATRQLDAQGGRCSGVGLGERFEEGVVGDGGLRRVAAPCSHQTSAGERDLHDLLRQARLAAA